MDIIIAVAAVAMIGYHMLSTQVVLTSVLEHQNIHLGCALVLVFLFSLRRRPKRWWPLILVFILLSMITTVYIHVYNVDLTWRMGFPIFSDVIIGTILILLVLEATRQSFGLVLPVVVLVFILYTAFGYLLPPPLYSAQFTFEKLVSKLSLLQGMYGAILGISAQYLFLFVAFGAILQISGAGKFMVQVGRLVGRRLAGGVALTAVTSSAMMGSLTGSVAANIVTTGAYTIPMMKRAGYRPEQAAAMEAAASTGGQFMPPIMGAAAFVMVGITGIPYSTIMLASVIPALLYFLGVGLYAQFQAMRLGIKPITEKIDYREMLSTSYLFIVPISLLIVLLILDYSPMYAIFWTIISLIVLSLIRKENRQSLRPWAEGFGNGAELGAQIGVCCALIGIIVSCVTLTGLGLKLPGLVETISGGNLGIALFITALVALILGCGMTTVAAYVIVVIVTAPVLVNMGVSLLTAHLFAFFFSIMNFVTPPVAVGALVASKVAGGDFLRTSVHSSMAAMGGFIVPFLFVLAPVLTLQSQATALEMTINMMTCLVILITFATVINNYYLAPLTIVERFSILISGALLFAFLATKNYIFTIGFAFFIAITLWQLRTRRINHNRVSSGSEISPPP